MTSFFHFDVSQLSWLLSLTSSASHLATFGNDLARTKDSPRDEKNKEVSEICEIQAIRGIYST